MVFLFPIFKKKDEKDQMSDKTAMQVKKLWQIAQSSMRERKPLRAEKALLAILHVDEKNAAAYNRLGILYAKSQKYAEAIECFEIAQSLDNNASSLHNVGLIYLETGEYEKAAMAFRQALELESDMPSRYIALSKAEEKLGHTKKAIKALENAYELDPKVSTLRLILAIYEDNGDEEAVTATAARIEEQIVRDNESKRRKSLSNARKSILNVSKKSKAKATASTKKVAIKQDKTNSKKPMPRVIKQHVGRKRI